MRRVTALNQHRLNSAVVPTDDSRSQHAHTTSLLVASLPSIVFEASTGSRPESAARKPHHDSLDNLDNDAVVSVGGQWPLWSRHSSSSLDIESQSQSQSQSRSLAQAQGNSSDRGVATDKDTMCMVCLSSLPFLDFVPAEGILFVTLSSDQPTCYSVVIVI